MLRLLSLACLATLARPAASEEFSLAPTEIRVPVGEAKALEFGTVPQNDTTVLLEVKARMESPGLGGSMYFLELKLNGQPVLPAKSRTVCRLVNKPFESPVAAGIVSQWHGSGGWRVLYAPDFEAAKSQRFYAGDPYTLVLDVTDLTNPAAENRLELTNSATPAFAKRLNSSLDLVIGALNVRTQPGASPTMAAATVLAPVINRGEPGAGPAAYEGELLPGGGVRGDRQREAAGVRLSVFVSERGAEPVGGRGAGGERAGRVGGSDGGDGGDGDWTGLLSSANHPLRAAEGGNRG